MSQHINPDMTQSNVVDNLTTNDGTKALSAKQGKALSEQISNTIEITASSVPNDFNYGLNPVAIASGVTIDGYTASTKLRGYIIKQANNVLSGAVSSNSGKTVVNIGYDDGWKANSLSNAINGTSISGTSQSDVFSNIDNLLSGAGFCYFYFTNTNAQTAGLASANHMCLLLASSASNSVVIAFRLNASEVKIINKTNGTWATTWKTISTT